MTQNKASTNNMNFNSEYLEENGYWYSEHSGIWYQKFYKDADRKYYGWQKVESENSLEALNMGCIPYELEDQIDDAYETARDQQLDLNN